MDIERFIDAHKIGYDRALSEIKNGKKITHWIWYIFPQIDGLGSSDTAVYYAIKNKEEAKLYLDNELLYSHMFEICNALLKLNNNITEILGYPDDLKLKSSMTLFSLVSDNDIFKNVLDKFYNGELDNKTIELLSERS